MVFDPIIPFCYRKSCRDSEKKPRRSGVLFEDCENQSNGLRLLSAARGKTQQAQTGEHHGVGFGFGDGRDRYC